MTPSLGRIVLVETHAPGNLGAVARVMRNFDFTDLVLVRPLASRDDAHAKQMATRGEEILTQARIVDSLHEAIADCTIVVGTSALTGSQFRRQTVGTPREILPTLANTRFALVFGPEPTGLSLEDISVCHHLLHIPTSEEYGAPQPRSSGRDLSL